MTIPYFPYGQYKILNFFHITYHQTDVCMALANPQTRQSTFERLGIPDKPTQDKLLPASHAGPIPESAWQLLREELDDEVPEGAW